MLRSFLLLNPIYTTLFWAVLLFFMDKKQNAARMMLCVFMCVSCLLYVSHYFFFQRICQVYAVFDGTYVGCSLAVYPLFHIYIRLLTVDRVFSFQKHIWYLAIPLLFMILIYGGYLFLSKEQSIEYVKNILPSAQFGHGVFGYLKRVYLISRLVFVFQCFFYLYLNLKLLAVNRQRLENLYSNIEREGLNWLKVFNILFAFALLSSIILAIIGRGEFMTNDKFLIFPSVVFSILLFAYGFFGFIQTLNYVDKEEFELKNSENFNLVDSMEYTEQVVPSHFKEKLLTLFEVDKVYLDKELKIWDITEKIGTNRTYVSKIINQEFDANFCTFVNNYRVEEVKRNIEKKQKASLEEIADVSGFGSVNSMTRAFLLKENQTIAQFKKKITRA